MNITKEFLEQRKAQILQQHNEHRIKMIDLEAALKKVQADLAACEGAIQGLDLVLKRLQETEPARETNPVPVKE